MEGESVEGRFGGTKIRDDGRGPVLLSHRMELTVIEGPDRGQSVVLDGQRITIGTDPQCTLRLSDPLVSRKHCEIFVEMDRYRIRDLQSTNGTELDGTEVMDAFLWPRARLGVGSTLVLFEPKQKWERVERIQENHFGELYGQTRSMQEVFGLLTRVAKTDLSCLLIGETGTGKELAAKGLHMNSPRQNKPFVVVDCGAINANLTEAELFGHEKGAFTGADRSRQGAFEAADGGTVFLDEVGELPSELQPKLLRVLENHEVKRLGTNHSSLVDVRIIAATHRNLEEMVSEGSFREDLYYRLAEIIVRLPPLRERTDDIPLIASRILRTMKTENGSESTISLEALEALKQRKWDGNVRELRNLLRRAAALAPGQTLSPADFGPRLYKGRRSSVVPEGPDASAGLAVEINDEVPIRQAREEWSAPLEREYLIRVLRRTGGNLDHAAEHAGIHRKSFERLLRQHQLRTSEV